MAIGGLTALGAILSIPWIIEMVGERMDKRSNQRRVDYLGDYVIGNRRTEEVCTTLHQSHEEPTGYESAGAESTNGNAHSIQEDDSRRI